MCKGKDLLKIVRELAAAFARWALPHYRRDIPAGVPQGYRRGTAGVPQGYRRRGLSMVRLFKAAGAIAGLAVIGATSAAAFSYTNVAYYNGVAAGGGYGNFYRSGYNTAPLTSTLRDYVVDGTRPYASARAFASGGRYFGVEGPRLSDGSNYWVGMATKTGYSSGAMVGYTGYVRVCQDVSWAADPCSSENSGGL